MAWAPTTLMKSIPPCPAWGLRDLDAVLVAQPAFEHLVPRHPDAYDEVVAHLPAHRFHQLESEAHAVLEGSSVLVLPVIDGGGPELLDQGAGLTGDLDAVEVAFARAAHRLRIVAVGAGDVVMFHLHRKGAMDELSPAGSGVGGQPVGAVPAFPAPAMGELHGARGPVRVNALGHRPVLRNHRITGAVDLSVVEGVLDRHCGGAAELREADAAARLLLLVAQITLRNAAPHCVARRVAGAEQPVADLEVLDGERGEERGVRVHGVESVCVVSGSASPKARSTKAKAKAFSFSRSKRARRSSVSGVHVGLEKQEMVVGLGGREPRHPLRGLPVAHPRIRESCGREDVRVVLGLDVVVGRVRLDVRVGVRVRERIAPLRPLGRGEGEGLVAHRVQNVHEGHLRHCRLEEVRLQVDRRPHQQPARAAAVASDTPASGIALGHQVLARCDEVQESVLLALELAVEVPPVPAFLAAAHVGHGVDEATLDEGKRRYLEARGDADAVGAVAVEQQGGRAVERGVAPVQHRNRHPRSVVGVGEESAGDIGVRVVAARHLLLLDESAFPGAHLVAPGARGSGGGAGGVVDAAGIELVAMEETQVVGIFLDLDRMLLATVQLGNHDAWQRLFTLHAHRMVAIHREVEDQASRPVGNQILPVATPGTCQRRLDDLEVLGIVRVGENQEAIVVMVDVVLDVALALRHEKRRLVGALGVYQPDLGGGVVVRVDHHEAPARSRADADEEAGVPTPRR